MEEKKEIGKRIKFRREQLGWTQEQLGKQLWLNKSTIQRYESGIVAKIKLPILLAMAKQLDVDPNWLALKTDEMGRFVERWDLLPPATEDTIMNLLKAEYDLNDDDIRFTRDYIKMAPDERAAFRMAIEAIKKIKDAD